MADRIDDFDPEQFATDAVAGRDPFEQFTAEEEDAYKNLPPVNIMIAGQAGVGKSTLINAVLRKPVARVGVGEPVTKHIKSYSVPGVPITLYDTPGLELGHNAKDVAEEFLGVIEESAPHPRMNTSICSGSASPLKERASSSSSASSSGHCPARSSAASS